MRYKFTVAKEQFNFLQMPRKLKERKDIKPELKYLYVLMYDLLKVSMENMWCDENDDVYIYMSVETIEEEMCCSKKTAIKMKKDLEKIGLIEDIQMGCNKPNRIYVHKIEEV